MRAQLYPDGVRRINAKIEIPMSYDDVSDYIVAAIASDNVTLDEVQNLNKRELLRVAKGEIYNLGVEAPRQLVTNVDRDTSVIVKNYVKRMFPELDE
jgi:hypothetical protein